MSTKPDVVTGTAIKRAIEGRDGRMLTSFYCDDAVMRIVDRNNAPSKPRVIKGKSAIGAFGRTSAAGRSRTRSMPAKGSRLAFTQACGAKVFCAAMIELKGGRIADQTVVQAWDE
jgi:hypothetical protein